MCRGRGGAGYVHDATKEEKTQKLNAKSPHEESENHKNTRFQMQCNDIVILANKQEKFVPKINKWGDWNKKVLGGKLLKD